ncbi:unnamed protein product [Laminaria digitata]
MSHYYHPPPPSNRVLVRRRQHPARGVTHAASRKVVSAGPHTSRNVSATPALTPPAAACNGTTTRVTSGSSGPGLAAARAAGDHATSNGGLRSGWSLGYCALACT